MQSRNDQIWRRLTGFALLMAAGWVVALLYHHVMGAVLRLPYPASTFLFDPSDRFGDLINTWRQARAGAPYTPGSPAEPIHPRDVAAYFPLVYAALRVLHRASGTWVKVIYLIVSLGASGALAFAWIRRERPRWAGDSRWPVAAALVAFVVLGNYPFLLALDRGNFDPIIAALAAGAVLALHAGRPLAGAALLGLSAAAKGYPIVAALLWIRQRRPAGAALAFATLAALVVLPGLLLEGGIPATLAGLAAGIGRFRALYVIGDGSAHYSADGLNAVRIALTALGRTPDPRLLVPAYELLAVLWAGGLAVVALLFAGAVWRQALAVVLVMLVFPNVTNDYKLVLLVPVVLAWFAEEQPEGWRDRAFRICAALLFVPKHYGPVLAGRDATVSTLVSPLLLAGLTAAVWPTAAEVAQARERVARVRATLAGRAGASALPERR